MTPCAIVKQFADGQYRIGSIRSSGYPAYVGVFLHRFYTDPAKIEALIDGGWGYCIEAELADISFDPSMPAPIHPDRHTALARALEEGPAYLWEDGQWFYITDTGSSVRLLPMTRAFLIEHNAPLSLLDAPEAPQTTLERLYADFAARAAANTDPHITYMHGPGFMAVSATTDTDWPADDPRLPNMNVRTVGDLRRALERYGDDVPLDLRTDVWKQVLVVDRILHGVLHAGRPTLILEKPPEGEQTS